jgi:diaminopimelate decarboxylase
MREKLEKSINFQEVAEQFGTPFYVYDGKTLVENYQQLAGSLPDCVDVFYALKVNPNVSLCALLKTQGANAEVCSLTELEIALKAGYEPNNIIFLGPSKSDEEVQRALEVGVFALVIESSEEFYRVDKIAESLGKKANVAIRINPEFSTKFAPLKMGGRPTHFGIEEAQLFEVFADLREAKNVNIMGLHVYNGSRILEARGIYENTQYILGLYERVSEKFNHKFSMIDVGGGMGVPYFANEKELNMAEFAELLIPLFEEFNKRYPDTRILMESGRYIAATSGAFVCRVNNIKKCYGEEFLITDGGTHCHLSAVGIGAVVQRNFPTENISVNENSSLDKKTYNVAGVLCNPEDLLARKIEMPLSSTGDLIAIFKSGAYGPSASPAFFHSQGHPKEILIHQGQSYLIRKQDKPEDIISRQILVDSI